MIIYLEGPDGSGKSTLADNIAKMCQEKGYEFDRFAEKNISTHPQRPDRIDKEHMLDELRYMANTDIVHILDRGPISDNIYRMFDNFEPVAKLEDYVKLFKEGGDKVMIIYTRTENAEKAMLERGDDNPVALRRHKELTKAYDAVMGILNCAINFKLIKFDYMEEGATEGMLKIVEAQIEKLKGGTPIDNAT